MPQTLGVLKTSQASNTLDRVFDLKEPLSHVRGLCPVKEHEKVDAVRWRWDRPTTTMYLGSEVWEDNQYKYWLWFLDIAAHAYL